VGALSGILRDLAGRLSTRATPIAGQATSINQWQPSFHQASRFRRCNHAEPAGDPSKNKLEKSGMFSSPKKLPSAVHLSQAFHHLLAAK